MSLQCKQNTTISNKNKPEKNSGGKEKILDSLRAQEILGFNDISSATLVIQRDTVFVLIPHDVGKSKYEFVRNFYYDSINKAFHFNFNARENSNIEFIKLQSFLNEPQVYLRSLRKPGISYPNLPDKLKKNPQIKNILTEDVRIQKYNESYYFINIMSPRAINVYSTATNKIETFFLRPMILHVTDFFLYDIDKDAKPEIFILHTGMIPRDEIISYSICSLRSDPLTIYAK